jgi:hypothetical protein
MEKASAVEVIREMMNRTLPGAPPAALYKAAIEVVSVGLQRAPTGDDMRLLRRRHAVLAVQLARTEQGGSDDPPSSGPGWYRTVTLTKRPRTTSAAREMLAADLKRKYEAGASIRALAEETGRSYGFVHRMLSEAGVHLRGRGGASRRKRRPEGG